MAQRRSVRKSVSCETRGMRNAALWPGAGGVAAAVSRKRLPLPYLSPRAGGRRRADRCNGCRIITQRMKNATGLRVQLTATEARPG